MYSVVGNTLYINWLYQRGTNVVTGSSPGAGTYFYHIPYGYTFKNVVQYSNYHETGTRVGTGYFSYNNNNSSRIVSLFTKSGAYIVVTTDFALQSSSFYQYNLPYLSLTFEAAIPIA